MGFDDLARHLAARDGKRGSGTSDPDQIMAEARDAQHRMSRNADLILGPLLLIGGIAFTAFSIAASSGSGGGLMVFAYGAIIAGAAQTGRGLWHLRKR